MGPNSNSKCPTLCPRAVEVEASEKKLFAASHPRRLVAESSKLSWYRSTSRRARHDGRGGGGLRRDRRRPRGSNRGASAAPTRVERYARSFDRSNPVEPHHPRPTLRADHRRRCPSRVFSRPLVLTPLDPSHDRTRPRARATTSDRPRSRLDRRRPRGATPRVRALAPAARGGVRHGGEQRAGASVRATAMVVPDAGVAGQVLLRDAARHRERRRRRYQHETRTRNDDAS